MDSKITNHQSPKMTLVIGLIGTRPAPRRHLCHTAGAEQPLCSISDSDSHFSDGGGALLQPDRPLIPECNSSNCLFRGKPADIHKSRFKTTTTTTVLLHFPQKLHPQIPFAQHP